jgi:hypothetical protein
VPSKQLFISGEQVRVSGELVSICHTRWNVCLMSRYPTSVWWAGMYVWWWVGTSVWWADMYIWWVGTSVWWAGMQVWWVGTSVCWAGMYVWWVGTSVWWAGMQVWWVGTSVWWAGMYVWWVGTLSLSSEQVCKSGQQSDASDRLKRKDLARQRSGSAVFLIERWQVGLPGI